MAKFRLWYRTEEVGSGQFIAVVTCVPDGNAGVEATPVESECRVFRDRKMADDACTAMAAAISARLQLRGDEITLKEAV